MQFSTPILKGVAKAWFKTLPGDSINLWEKLCDEFITQFTTRKRQPKTIVVLSDINSKKKTHAIIHRLIHKGGSRGKHVK